MARIQSGRGFQPPPEGRVYIMNLIRSWVWPLRVAVPGCAGGRQGGGLVRQQVPWQGTAGRATGHESGGVRGRAGTRAGGPP